MPGFYPDLAPRIDSTASVQPRRGVDLPAVLAAELGAVHGLVGTGDDILGCAAVHRIEGDAHAGRQTERPVGEDELQGGDLGADPPRQLDHFRLVGIGDENRELAATEAEEALVAAYVGAIGRIVAAQPRRALQQEFGADPVQIVILEGADAPPQEQRQERSHDQGGHRHEAEDQMPAQGGAAGEYRSLERPDQHLGAALVVVEFALDRRQRVYASFGEAALHEPVGGSGGQDEQALQLHLARLGLDMAAQLVAVAGAPVLGHDGQTGQLGGPFVAAGKRIQGRAADNDAVMVEQRKTIYLHFQPLAAAAHQGAVGLQRGDQGQDGADVVAAGLAQPRQRRLGHHRADALAGEEFHQHGAVGAPVEEVHPPDAGPAGAQGAGQDARHFGRLVDAPLEQLPDLVGRGGVDRLAALVQQTGRRAEEDQLVGLEGHGHRLGNLLPGQVEDFAGRRGADRRYEDDIFLVEVGADLVGIDLAHGAGVLVIDTVDHADRLGGDEIAAGDADPGTGHRRVRQA